MQTQSRARAILCGLMGCAAGLGQLDTATVLETVFDSSGAVGRSARVAVENHGTGATVEVVTDGHGDFLGPVAPVGAHRVTFSAHGFMSHLQMDIPCGSRTASGGCS